MDKIEASHELDKNPRKFSFQEIYDKVHELNQHKSSVELDKRDQDKELDSQLFALVKQLNDDYSLGLDNNSLDLQADDGKLQINYRSSEYGGGDKKVQITIDEDVARQVVYDGYHGGNILFENTFEKKSEQKQLANHKFDEIYNEINKNKGVSYKDDKGEEIRIVTASSSDFKSMVIEKNGEFTYRLKNENGKFTLNYGPNFENVIGDVTPEELLNNILPNFEKRLNEAMVHQQQQRKKALEDADQYAYQQDQKDADNILQENGLV